MKRKRMIITLVCIVVLSLVVNVSVYASLSATHEDLTIANEWVERKGASQKKEFNLNDAEKTAKKLTYNQSRMLTQKRFLDIYTDESGNEYRFDEHGEITSYFNCEYFKAENSVTAVETKASEKEKEKAIIAIAWEELSSRFNIDANEYKFVSCDKSSEYHVLYAKRYGKDGFILGPAASATLSLAGNVLYSGVDSTIAFDEFEEGCLEGITKEMVLEEVDRQVRAAYGENLQSYAVEDISLRYENDRFVLRSGVSVFDINGLAHGNYYYYEIS